VKLLIHTGLEDTAEQNKALTYEYGHCVDRDWQGAVWEEMKGFINVSGMWVSYHPYGEIIVVQQ